MHANTRFDSRVLLDNRQIRIFLSSTFSDMQEERTALLKTFETLRIMAHRRNVDLMVLDLRWGVTDEEARSGKVLSVCLNEIEHSHPFFIGLLGNRYGYAPSVDELRHNPDLLERYPWLAADVESGRSITEIEMLYGALRNEDDVDAVFYIRHDPTIDDDPRQATLKDRIRGQRRYPVSDYSDVEELCKLVERDVTTILNRHFPDIEASPLENIRIAHRAYANSRLSHFVGREEELGWINDFVQSNKRHLVINGESGIGKSALLAHWCRQNESGNAFNLIYHFVGNTLGSSNYEGILRHICDEIYDLYGINRHSNQTEKLEEEAQRLVNEVGRRQQPLVVVLDGINQLCAPKDEKLLLWLPSANAKIQFIFTTLPNDATMHTFQRRGYDIRTLQPLTYLQRRSFAKGYLERLGKHLSAGQWLRILNYRETRNTLVLRTLLDELICFGIHEQLDSRIDFYLSACDTADFFGRVLQRYEQDYGRELVSHSLTLLALSERGLSEEELLAITCLRKMDWHFFYCAAYNHLIVRDGLIGFAHSYLAAAVEQRYVTANATMASSLRRETAIYFSALAYSDRRIAELAHQYYNLADWQHLFETLVSFDAFNYYQTTNEPLFALYWRSLRDQGYSMAAYMELPHHTDDNTLSSAYNNIGVFVNKYYANYMLAQEYFSKALIVNERMNGSENLDIANLYNNIGVAYQKMSNYPMALEHIGKALAIREHMLGVEHPDTAQSYNNLGVLYADIGNNNKAIEYHETSLAIREKVLGTEHPDTAQTYHNIGLAFCNMGNNHKALAYFEKALKIREKVLGSEHPETAKTYNNIGLIYKNKGDYPKAIEYFGKSLTIYNKTLGAEHPETATSYNNIGTGYDKMGDYYNNKLDNYTEALDYYNKALDNYNKAFEIREKVFGTEHISTAISYINIGGVYYKKALYLDALESLNNALPIWEHIVGTMHPNTALLYNEIGAINYYLGYFPEALECLNKSLSIQKKVLGPIHPSTIATKKLIKQVTRRQNR